VGIVRGWAPGEEIPRFATAGASTAGVTLWTRLPVGVPGRIGAAMVLLAGLAMVVAGLHRQDCSELVGACSAAEATGTLSDHHVIHQLVSLAVFLVLTIAMFPLARGWRRNGGPARLAVATRIVGGVGVLVIAMMVTVGFGGRGGPRPAPVRRPAVRHAGPAGRIPDGSYKFRPDPTRPAVT
jgi:hypothetical protein